MDDVLGKLALHHLLRPISSASCERIFSILTDMDRSNRRLAGRDLIINNLKLRGNKDVVSNLIATSAADTRAGALQARVALSKRNRDSEAKEGPAAVEGAKRARKEVIVLDNPDDE